MCNYVTALTFGSVEICKRGVSYERERDASLCLPKDGDQDMYKTKVTKQAALQTIPSNLKVCTCSIVRGKKMIIISFIYHNIFSLKLGEQYFGLALVVYSLFLEREG